MVHSKMDTKKPDKIRPLQNNTARIYSSIFSALVLGLLISFTFLPKFNLSTINTNFHWQKDLIGLYTSWRLNIGDKVYNNAVIGKSGWVFFTGDNSMTDYQKADTLKQKELFALQTKLDRLNKDLKDKGVALLVVIPPNKSTIYSQYMPDEIPVLGQISQLDQFVKYMKLHGDTFVLDLRPTLLDANQPHAIYYKTDTHWNDVGAYYGYVGIMHALELNYPVMIPRPISDFTYTYKGTSVRDLPLLMGLSKYPEENWVLTPNFANQLTETKITLPDGRFIRTVINTDKQLPKLLVFDDSFYGSLAHFIEPHFSRVKTIPFTYENDVWSLDWIQRENPDIVIIEVVERDIDVALLRLFEN